MKRNRVSVGGNVYIDVDDGPCILLIHAFGFDADMWEPQLIHMQSAGHRVIAPEAFSAYLANLADKAFPHQVATRSGPMP